MVVSFCLPCGLQLTTCYFLPCHPEKRSDVRIYAFASDRVARAPSPAAVPLCVVLLDPLQSPNTSVILSDRRAFRAAVGAARRESKDVLFSLRRGGAARFRGENRSRFFSRVVTSNRLPFTISNLPKRKRFVLLLVRALRRQPTTKTPRKNALDMRQPRMNRTRDLQLTSNQLATEEKVCKFMTANHFTGTTK